MADAAGILAALADMAGGYEQNQAAQNQELQKYALKWDWMQAETDLLRQRAEVLGAIDAKWHGVKDDRETENTIKEYRLRLGLNEDGSPREDWVKHNWNGTQDGRDGRSSRDSTGANATKYNKDLYADMSQRAEDLMMASQDESLGTKDRDAAYKQSLYYRQMADMMLMGSFGLPDPKAVADLAKQGKGGKGGDPKADPKAGAGGGASGPKPPVAPMAQGPQGPEMVGGVVNAPMWPMGPTPAQAADLNRQAGRAIMNAPGQAYGAAREFAADTVMPFLFGRPQAEAEALERERQQQPKYQGFGPNYQR